MTDHFAAVRARLVIERDNFLRQVDVLNEEARGVTRDRDKFRAQADALSLAIEMIEESVPAQEETTTRGRLNIAEAIVADLGDAPDGRTLQGVCAAIGRKPSVVAPALRRLLNADRVSLVDGVYRPVAA